MAVFTTPAPIAVTIELVSGVVRILATQRADTAVTISPIDETNPADFRAAHRTTVELAGDRLLVLAPDGEPASIAVRIELPVGSTITGRAGAAEFRCEGRLGDCELRTVGGAILTTATASLTARTGHGQIIAGEVTGRAELSSDYGDVSVQRIEGAGVLRAADGAIRVGAITAELRAEVGRGELIVDRAAAAVSAEVASGGIWLGEVVRGPVTLTTGAGNIEVGVRPGSKARLDLLAPAGRVLDRLADPGGPGEDKVELAARTDRGDIRLRRAHPG